MKAKFISSVFIIAVAMFSVWMGATVSEWMVPGIRPVTLGGPNRTVYKVYVNGEGDFVVENKGEPKVNWNW